MSRNLAETVVARLLESEPSEERFRQPENFDVVKEGAGWKLYAGGNDWEPAPTAVAVVFPGDEQIERLWFNIRFPEGLRSKVMDGDGGEDVRREGRTHAQKAWRTWARVAQERHQNPEPNQGSSWQQAFKAALQDKEVAAFVDQWGEDRTEWRSTTRPDKVTEARQLTLYHGTSSRHVPRIQAEGLDRPHLGVLEVARYFAEEAAAQNGGQPVVLRIQVAASMLRADRALLTEPIGWGGLASDEVLDNILAHPQTPAEMSALTSLQLTGGAVCTGHIAPAQIQPERPVVESRRGPTAKALKKGRTKLTDAERQAVLDAGAVWHHGPGGAPTPAVWKSVVNGKTWYCCNTHRAGVCKPTLKSAIPGVPVDRDDSLNKT